MKSIRLYIKILGEDEEVVECFRIIEFPEEIDFKISEIEFNWDERDDS